MRARPGPLGKQATVQGLLPVASRGFDQRQVDHVALCVAAAEAVGGGANAPDQADGFIIPTIAERLDGARGCVPDLARKGGIVVPALHCRTLSR